MLDILWNSLFFIVALGVLVTIHEYGHFWVARKLGVKVLTFSVGLGKPILQKIGTDGVRYVLSVIPLGGYVKMLDEREEGIEISKQDLPFAFNRQTVWVRLAIVLAGPAANFILAIVLYWVVLMAGIERLIPLVGHVQENSIAFDAGLKENDRILAVDQAAIFSQQDLVEALIKRLGDQEAIILSVKREDFSQPKMLRLAIKNWRVDDKKPEILHSLGIYHPLEKLTTEIASVAKSSVADKATIKTGDKVTQINGRPVASWQAMVEIIQKLPNQLTNIQVNRKGELIDFSVVIASQEVDGRNMGYLGVGSKRKDPTPYIVLQKAGPLDAIALAFQMTYQKILLTAQLFKKLLVRDISHKSISGPLSIAEGAGNSARSGWLPFISFLAIISVNLGFINLLPVPLLDGGHLLYFTVEAIRGKPLSQKVQEFGLQIGMMVVFLLMATAIYNDLGNRF